MKDSLFKQWLVYKAGHQALPEYQPADARVPRCRALLPAGCASRLYANKTERNLRRAL